MGKRKVKNSGDLGKPYKFDEVGQTALAGAQEYRCVGLRKFQGAFAEYLVVDLESECCECGVPIKWYMPAEGAQFYPSRRCKEHSRRGVAARAKKQRVDIFG